MGFRVFWWWTSGWFTTFVIFSTKLKHQIEEETILKRWFLCVFARLGCSFGGGGDQKIPTHQELPELLTHSWLFHFWGDRPQKPSLYVWTLSACGTKTFWFFLFFVLDGNYEEWVWASVGPAAHGTPQHEEVRLCTENSLKRFCLGKLQKRVIWPSIQSGLASPRCFSFSLWRYELPAPSSGQKNDISAWQECVNNSMAQLEHQGVRIENLELMAQFGTNAWKVYNE